MFHNLEIKLFGMTSEALHELEKRNVELCIRIIHDA